MSQLQWLGECMRGRQGRFFVAMGLAVLAALLYVAYPLITSQITDQVLIGIPQADGSVLRNLTLLPTLLLLLLVTQGLRMGSRFSMVCLLEQVSQDMIERLRLEIYENLSNQDSSFYDEYRTGDLMTRLTGDMDMVRHTVSWISFNVVESTALFLFSVVYFFTINVKLTLILLAIAPFLGVATFFYAKTAYPLYARLREKLSGLNTLAQENISGNKVVRAFAREPHECQRFAVCNGDFREANLNANMQWLRFFPFVEICSQIMNVLILVIGGVFVVKGQMSIGDVTAFFLLSWGISVPMREMGIYLNDLQRFFASASKVMEVHNMDSRIVTPKHGKKPSTTERGSVEFKNVSYHYGRNNALALSEINLSIAPGETVVIMGPTGSGKTTLLNAIVRLLDVTSGSILVDGADVREWEISALRGQIGVATQDVLLYSNTVDANIAYGNPSQPESEVAEFASLAAAGFVEKLPDGYETIIGERGTGLSGGQKQRIALARALAIRPAILMLDDTTSAVDLETEGYIQQSLNSLPFLCTKIIVAQRVSTARHADKIVVLQEGKITEMGRHEELLNQGGYYSELCALQGVEPLEEVE